jgi:hypothetical protein
VRRARGERGGVLANVLYLDETHESIIGWVLLINAGMDCRTVDTVGALIEAVDGTPSTYSS